MRTSKKIVAKMKGTPKHKIPVSIWSWWGRSWQRCRGQQQQGQQRQELYLFQLDHDEDDHGKDVKDNKKAGTDSDRKVVPVVISQCILLEWFLQRLWIVFVSKDGKERREITSQWDCGLDLGWLSLGAREQILQQGEGGSGKKQVKGIFKWVMGMRRNKQV